MKQRIVFGLAAAFALLALVFWGNLLMMTFVVVSFAVFAYIEFDRLFFASSSKLRHLRMSFLVTLTILALIQNQMAGWIAVWLSFIFLCSWMVFQSNRSGEFAIDTKELALEFLGLVYVVGLFGFLIPIWSLGLGRYYLMLLFMMVFLGDTGAYFVGIRIGKHRLATKLSPKKSIEGAIAAVLFTTGGGMLYAYYFIPSPPEHQLIFKLMLFGPVLSLLAQLGDLFESMFKRSVSQKDSGHFLPGHGGLLDRIDGLAFAAPVYYLFLLFFAERVT